MGALERDMPPMSLLEEGLDGSIGQAWFRKERSGMMADIESLCYQVRRPEADSGH